MNYPTTQSSLLERVQQGDEISWNEFYFRYAPVIRAAGMGFKFNETECDDLVQQVMLHFFNKSQAWGGHQIDRNTQGSTHKRQREYFLQESPNNSQKRCKLIAVAGNLYSDSFQLHGGSYCPRYLVPVPVFYIFTLPQPGSADCGYFFYRKIIRGVGCGYSSGGHKTYSQMTVGGNYRFELSFTVNFCKQTICFYWKCSVKFLPLFNTYKEQINCIQQILHS